MKKIVFLLILSSLKLTLYAWNNIDEIQEQIRRKIENKTIVGLSAGEHAIYCHLSLPKFYEARIFLPAWNRSSMCEELVLVLNNASKEGLNPQDYHLEELNELISSDYELSILQAADLDLLATDAFLLYASHLLSGKVNPVSTDSEWHVSRREGDPLALLDQALNTGNIRLAIYEAIPSQKIYLSLKNALRQYEQIKVKGGWETIPVTETLKPGMRHENISLIRNRLKATGDLVKSLVSDSTLYDEALFEAVKKFQQRYGLAQDGEIGKSTLAAMNVSIDSRIEQIKINLERWRWLPVEFSDYYIAVNIADFTLDVVKNGLREKSFKVIVGKNYRKTPVFSSKMTYIVLNPTWTVPPTILNNDILPAVKKNPAYLKTKNLTVLDRNGLVLDPATIDWQSPSVKSYTYRQPSGRDNALGAVKFMFPNYFNVYIHDTPSKELFESSERSFSSGCIRVQNPLALAEYLLDDSVKWSDEKIKKIVASNKPETISLVNKPDVYILYWTAWSDENGVVQFRNDIYNRDNAIAKSLFSPPPAMNAL